MPSPAPQAASTPAEQQDPQAPLSALPDKATTIPSQHSHRTVLAFEGNQQILQLASTFFRRQKLISASLTVYPSGKASSWNCISVLHERKPPRRCEANGAALPKPVSVPAVPRDSVRTRPTLYRYSTLWGLSSYDKAATLSHLMLTHVCQHALALLGSYRGPDQGHVPHSICELPHDGKESTLVKFHITSTRMSEEVLTSVLEDQSRFQHNRG